jgi:hypothetical protein
MDIVEPAKPQLTVWCMRTACCIHSQYVIVIAFSLQQWLHECAVVLGYTYIACLVIISIHGSSLCDSYSKYPNLKFSSLSLSPWCSQSSCTHRQLVQFSISDIWVHSCYLSICTSRWPIQWILKLRHSAISVMNYLFINSQRRWRVVMFRML